MSHDFESVADILNRMSNEPGLLALSAHARAHAARFLSLAEDGRLMCNLNDSVEGLRILDELIALFPAEEAVKVWRHVALSRINPEYLESPSAYVPSWEIRKNRR